MSSEPRIMRLVMSGCLKAKACSLMEPHRSKLYYHSYLITSRLL